MWTVEGTCRFPRITFSDIKAATYSTAAMDGALLHNRVVLMRTRGLGYAKFMARRSAMSLDISDLTTYDKTGLIVLYRASFRVRSSFFGDLLTGGEAVGLNQDFFWHGVSPGVVQMEPLWGMFVVPDFEQIGPSAILGQPFVADPVGTEALRRQTIFCSSGSGASSKLLIEASGSALVVQRLVTYSASGRKRRDRSGLRLGKDNELNIETGTVVSSGGGHLRLERNGAGRGAKSQLQPVNGAAISFPSYFRFLKYVEVLASPVLRGAMSFDRAGAGLTTYDRWTVEQRLQLDEYLYLLETGRPLTLTGPPLLTFDVAQLMSAADATKIYLAHVAQSVWTEATGAVPWSIANAGAQTLEYLFDSRKLLSRAASAYYFNVMGHVTDWNPRLSYEFLRDNGLIGADHFDTIKRFCDWGRRNLQHITDYRYDPNGPFMSQQEQNQFLYGYKGYPPVDKILVPLPNRAHVTAGCWGTSGLLAAVLRSVSIPVRHGRSSFDGGTHSRAEFFSVGQSLAHSDDPYSRAVGAGHHTPPIDVIFYTDAALAAEIDAPPPLPGKTMFQTATINYESKFARLAVQYKTDYLLGTRCYDIANGNAMPGMTWSRLGQFLHNAYTNAQMIQIGLDCDAEIAALGGCSQIPPI